MLTVTEFKQEDVMEGRNSRRTRSGYSFLMFDIRDEEELVRFLTERYGKGTLEYVGRDRYWWSVGDTIYNVIVN